MSDFKKTILLEIDIDNSDAERRMAQLTQEIDKLKTANKENTKETQAQRVEVEKNNVAIKSAQQEYNNLKSSLVSNTNAAKANKGSYTELYNQWKAAEAQLKNMAGAFKTNDQGITELTQEYHEQSKAVDDLKKNLLLFNAGISQGNLNVGNYGNTLEGMRMQLQQMRADLEKVEVGSVAFVDLKNKIDETSTSLQQAEGKIDSMGEKVAKNKIKDNFNDLQSSAMAATAAIGVLSLSMGTDTKAGEVLRKITIGLTLAQTALTIAKSKDDIIGSALLIKNKALAASQWLYTTAVGASTGALKAFRTALLTTGIGAVIAGLVILIQRLRTSKDATDEAAEAQKGYNERMKEAKEREDLFADALAGQNTALKRKIELRKAEGASAEEILKLNKDLLKDEQAGIELALKSNITDEKKVQLQERLLEITNDLKILDAEYYKQQVEIQKKKDEQALKDRQSTTESIELITEPINRQKELIEQFRPLLTYLYGKDVVDGALAYNDALESQEDALKGVEQAKKNLADIQLREDAERDARLAKQQEQLDMTVNVAKQMGAALADVLTDSEDRVKDFNKQILLMSIKALKNQIQLAMAEGILKELAAKGFAGIVTGAILAGLMEAAFGVAINSIEGFATGGKIKGGTPINRANGDNVLITAKTGEVIMNENQQRKLQSVAGRDVFSKLGIPGFDSGGLIGSGINTNVNNALSLSEMRSINNMLRNQPAPVLGYQEFTNFKQRVELAEQAGSLV